MPIWQRNDEKSMWLFFMGHSVQLPKLLKFETMRIVVVVSRPIIIIIIILQKDYFTLKQIHVGL